jgi:hypothetical protein
MTVNEQPAKNKKRGWGLLRRQEVSIPTWRGWLLAFLLLAIPGFALSRCIYPFLAIHKPFVGGLLVVEGWAPDYVLRSAIEEFQRDRYARIYVTGGPVEIGAPLSQYENFAAIGASTLVKLGLPTNAVQAVPAPRVAQDRTFASAVTLKRWWIEHGITPFKVQVMSLGPHTRRSRLLYQKAFGKGVTIGITSVPPRDYDPKRWWRSSAGFRTVTGEVIAYLYARLIFTGREAEVPAANPVNGAAISTVYSARRLSQVTVRPPAFHQWPAGCIQPG